MSAKEHDHDSHAGHDHDDHADHDPHAGHDHDDHADQPRPSMATMTMPQSCGAPVAGAWHLH